MVGDGNLTATQGTKGKLYRFAVRLWLGIALVVLLVPWPYALVAVLFATFLHLAALDGDTPTRQQARRKFGR